MYVFVYGYQQSIHSNDGFLIVMAMATSVYGANNTTVVTTCMANCRPLVLLLFNNGITVWYHWSGNALLLVIW